jgi:hypothetical protein
MTFRNRRRIAPAFVMLSVRIGPHERSRRARSPITVNERHLPSRRGSLRPSPRHLRGVEESIVRAAADAFFPPNGPIARSGSEADIVGWFDRHFATSPPRQLRLMRLLLRFVQLSPLVFGPRRKRFTNLPLPDRIDFLAGMSKSRIYFRRVAFLSLRTLMTMAYLADAGVMGAIGIEADTDPFGLGDAPPYERPLPPTPAASGVRLRGRPTDEPLDDVG